uniref:Uncharacterized protein n=1 Tax=Rhizophora mucronata TaxID=61149 RepID=A0A2P2LS86_RHIMU
MSMLTSFKALKETLRPCSSASLSTTTSSSSTSSFSQSSLSQERPEPCIVIPRKPPKSSLPQQLQRLGESFSLPPQEFSSRKPPTTHQTQQPKSPGNRTRVENVEDGEEEEEESGDLGRPKLGLFQFDHTGPFEPLVLSVPDDVPIVQGAGQDHSDNCIPCCYFWKR